MISKETFLYNLKRLRILNKYTLTEVNYKLKRSQGFYSKVEKGEKELQIAELFILCELYDVEPDLFFKADKKPIAGLLRKKRLHTVIEKLSPQDFEIVKAFVDTILLRDTPPYRRK